MSLVWRKGPSALPLRHKGIAGDSLLVGEGQRWWQLLWVNLKEKQQIPSLLKEGRPPCVGDHRDLQKPLQLGLIPHGRAMLEPGSGQPTEACPNPFHTRTKYVQQAMIHLLISIHLFIILMFLFIFWIDKPVPSTKIKRCIRMCSEKSPFLPGLPSHSGHS